MTSTQTKVVKQIVATLEFIADVDYEVSDTEYDKDIMLSIHAHNERNDVFTAVFMGSRGGLYTFDGNRVVRISKPDLMGALAAYLC